MAGKGIEAERFYKESSGMMRRMDVSVLRKAAEQGNARAQQYLGYMYENGEKVAKDGSEAPVGIARRQTRGCRRTDCSRHHVFKGARRC